ncbi:hypothetical protein [Actinomadura litoris]|uniref:Uncharacterized protein n=1 Tax=Actinomadura litoris TaxID=2678616 RepID=A0A7K1KWZ3_9ACTN|nr:hypothetical protein [Actinomadura litoris]MUN36476.1 hypothetical protein [Actinomadura litoris]
MNRTILLAAVAGFVAIAFAPPTPVGTPAQARGPRGGRADSGVRFLCWAPGGWLHCQDVLVPPGRRLVVRDRASREGVSFVVRVGDAEVGGGRVGAGEERAVWWNGGADAVTVGVDVRGAGVWVEGTMSTPR